MVQYVCSLLVETTDTLEEKTSADKEGGAPLSDRVPLDRLAQIILNHQE